MIDHAKEILKHLNRATASGISSHNIFDDFLDLSLATIEALPGHVKKAVAGEELCDTPETEKLFAQLRSRYPHRETWECFSKAFAVLLESTEEFRDTIGDVYMQFNVSNKYTGQFFTPWNIAECMAMMTTTDVEKELHNHIKTAIEKSPLGFAYLLAGCVIEDPKETEKWFFTKILPEVAPYVEPISVMDPCVGSGVMLLAAAKQFPRWAVDWGLVQFYGADIDQTCVKMARLNCMLYGMNGFSMRCASELSDLDLQSIPEPYSSAYRESRTATPERLVEIQNEIRPANAVQMRLFDTTLNILDPQ